MQKQQTTQGEVYYHVPLNKEEYFLYSRLTPLTPPQFYSDLFMDLLTTDRPERMQGVPFLVIRTNPMSPKKISWGSFNEKGFMDMLKSYTIESKQVMDELKNYAQRNPLLVRSNKNLMKPTARKPSSDPASLLLEKQILKHIQEIQQKRLTASRTRKDPYAAIVLFLLVVLALVFVVKPRKVAPLLDEEVFTRHIHLFINKIQNDKMRNHFIEFLKEIKQEKHQKGEKIFLRHLQKSLRENPAFSYAVSKYLNDVQHDDTILEGTALFLSTLPERSKDKFVNILQTVSGKTLSHKIKWMYQNIKKLSQQKRLRSLVKRQSILPSSTVVSSEKTPVQSSTSFLFSKLGTFLEQNKQMVVSPRGAFSPVFTQSLQTFLQEYPYPHSQQLKHFIYHQARQIIQEQPNISVSTMNNRLRNTVTQNNFHHYRKSKPRTTPLLNPSLKSTARRRSSQPPPSQQQKPKSQTSSVQPRQELQPLIQRLKKQHQKQQATTVMEYNIDKIMSSQKYQKIAPMLAERIRHFQIRNVYVVDAPNLLYPLTGSFHQRQQKTVNPDFVEKLRKQMNMTENDMMIVVSQMNARDWFHNHQDPIFSSRIGIDPTNNFHIRVGCIDTTVNPPVDCFRSVNFNEMDDFVRYDLMARLKKLLKEDTPPFFHITNDKGRNWKFLQIFPQITHKGI